MMAYTFEIPSGKNVFDVIVAMNFMLFYFDKQIICSRWFIIETILYYEAYIIFLLI